MRNVVLGEREACVARLVVDSGLIYNIKDIIEREIVAGSDGTVLGVEITQ